MNQSAFQQANIEIKYKCLCDLQLLEDLTLKVMEETTKGMTVHFTTQLLLSRYVKMK